MKLKKQAKQIRDYIDHYRVNMFNFKTSWTQKSDTHESFLLIEVAVIKSHDSMKQNLITLN